MKRATKHLRKDSQAGFGMLGVLMASAVGLVAVAGITESILLMARSQSSVEVTRQSLMIADQIDAALSNGTICTKMFAQVGLPTPLALPVSYTVPVPLTVTLPINGVSTPVGPSLDITPQLKVADFSVTLADPLVDPANAPVNFVIIDPVTSAEIPLTRIKIDLKFQTKKNAPGLFAPVSYPHKTKIQTVVNGAGNILSCIAENDETKACELSGGVWNPDPTAPAGSHCVPYKFCNWGGAFSENGLTDPGGFTNQLTGAATCPSGYVKKQSGAIAQAYRIGKTHIGNKMTAIYTCMRCGSPTAADLPMAAEVGAGLDSVLTDSESRADQNATNATSVRTSLCGTSVGCGSIP